MAKTDFKLPTFSGDGDTQIRILNTATRLFALKGFKNVTLKEIAKAVNIKIPSIYYYYKDKDALIEDVLLCFEGVYQECHDWLKQKNATAETLEDLLDNLFNAEMLEKLDPVVRLGMAMALREQHSYSAAYQSAYKHIYINGIANVKAGFDRLIEKGVIPPSDTHTLATLFMFVVMSGNELFIYELAGNEPPLDYSEIYAGLKKIIETALRQGTL